MATRYEDYAAKYQSVKFERRGGIVQMTLHADGGPALWDASIGAIHDELGDAFYQVGRDPDISVLILTGAGDTFLTQQGVRGPHEDNPAQMMGRIFKEGVDLITNLLEIDVPVIGAANGPAWIHAELLTLSDIVLASETASFADKAHFPVGVVPGDGVHVWWQMLLGPNRGRHFLLSGEEIDAHQAKSLGFVAEVIAHDKLNARAWELAETLAKQSPMTLRYTRRCFVQHIKRRMLDDLGYGLQLEFAAGRDRAARSEK